MGKRRLPLLFAAATAVLSIFALTGSPTAVSRSLRLAAAGRTRVGLVWRVAVGMGRSSGKTWVFLQIPVLPGASPWSSLPLSLLVVSLPGLLRRERSRVLVVTC